MIILLLLLLAIIGCGVSEREHKVHNIILYPEKHSWCQTTPIQQVVASPGYEPATIDNNVCVGACYSYSIPRTQPAEPGELIGPYCDSCQPIETKCYHVTLRRTDDEDNNMNAKTTHANHMDHQMLPKTTQKRVQIIMNCSCMSCEKIRREDCEISAQNTLELPSDLFANRTMTGGASVGGEEVPELLDFATTVGDLNLHNNRLLHYRFADGTNYAKRFELSAKMIALLKRIQQNDQNDHIEDKEQLKELLAMIAEDNEGGLSDKNLMDFVNFVNIHNSDDLELDLGRLKDVLTAFQKTVVLLEKHREFGLGPTTTQSTTTTTSRTTKLSSADNNRYDLIHHDNAIVDDNIKIVNNNNHHHLGEELHIGLDVVGHLVKGPHGSMILAPDLKVEEKLNLDSNILKPNHDGVVISYENHNIENQDNI